MYVLPSALIAKVLSTAHQKWLATPGKNGRAHNDSVMRRLLPDYARTFGMVDNPYLKGWLEPHRNAWSLLKLEAASVEQDTEK